MSSSQDKPCRKGHISGRRKSGNCIQCERERYQDPKRQEYVKSRQAERRAAIKADPEKYAEKQKYMRDYAVRNRSRSNELGKIAYQKNNTKIRLQRKGIIPEQWLVDHIENHSGKCDICGGNPDGRWKELSIDHCHSTGQFRGMLCTDCNTGIGKFKDDPELIRRAANYVEHYKQSVSEDSSERVRKGMKKH